MFKYRFEERDSYNTGRMEAAMSEVRKWQQSQSSRDIFHWMFQPEIESGKEIPEESTALSWRQKVGEAGIPTNQMNLKNKPFIGGT